MKTETMVQASGKTAEKLVKVQIQLSPGVCTGYVYCPRQRRLLDVLNGVTAREPRANEEFLPVREAKMYSPDGRVTTVQPAYINKANILFVRDLEDGQTRRLGGQAGHKPYPFVPKSSTAVRLYMPSYALSGQMHCAKGKGISGVLNSETRFIPLTDVDICPSTGSGELGVSFIAVNKGQILALEEVEPE